MQKLKQTAFFANRVACMVMALEIAGSIPAATLSRATVDKSLAHVACVTKECNLVPAQGGE